MKRVWAITYRSHDQQKMWGFFTLDFLKSNMDIFHTIYDNVCYMDLPEGNIPNESYPYRESKSEFVTKEKKIKFLRDTSNEVDKYIHRTYNKNDNNLMKFLNKARKDISYSDGTASVDILLILRRMYKKINSNPHTNEK